MHFLIHGQNASQKAVPNKRKPGELIGPRKRDLRKGSCKNLKKNSDKHHATNNPYTIFNNKIKKNMNEFFHFSFPLYRLEYTHYIPSSFVIRPSKKPSLDWERAK